MEIDQMSLIYDASDASTHEDHAPRTHFNDDEDDMSVLQYARHHGLCKDFLSEEYINRELLLPSPSGSQGDAEDDLNAADPCLPIELAPKERLVVDKEAASFLKAIFTLQHAEGYQETTTSRHRTVDLKQELPILKTDDELDLKRFGKRAIPDLSTIHTLSEPVDNKKGLEWSTADHDLPAQYDARADAEKLEITRDALLYLQATLKEPFTISSKEEIALAELHYVRNTALDPVTPPLLPLTPPMLPFVPSSPAGRLELLSDRTDSVIEESKVLERKLSRKDAIVPFTKNEQAEDDPMLLDHDDIGQVYSPLRSIAKIPPSPLKRDHTDHKVEAPLTPPTTLYWPEQHVRFDSFAEKLRERISELLPTHERGDGILDSQDSVDEFFKNQVAPIANQANQRLEHEELQEADSIKRVPVPVIDFPSPEPPWKISAPRGHDKFRNNETEVGAQRELLAIIKHEESKSVSQWHEPKKIERKLSWSPIPKQLGEVVLDEKVEDDGSLGELLTGMSLEGVVDSAFLIWKPGGLRILDGLDESEDELEHADIEEEKDSMEALLKRRKLQIENAVDHHAATAAGVLETTISGHAAHARPSYEHATPTAESSHMDREIAPPKADSDLMLGVLISASAALSKFMETRGTTVKEPKLDKAPEALASINKLPPAPYASRLPDSNVSWPVLQPVNAQVPPCPDIPSHPPPYCVIISSTLLTQRRLIRHIQALYPSLELIERDFTAHQKEPSSLADEADIILSPAAGTLYTSLQKIKQRALPGQISRAGIREKIQAVAARYERLFVYVSGGKTEDPGSISDAHALDDRDCDALASLIGFTASLDSDVQVIYVAGGEEALARWIVSAVVKYGINATSFDAVPEGMKLLQDETLWELFLRRAGLNAFAAQVTLAALKAPIASGLGKSSPGPSANAVAAERAGAYGLTAFVTMSSDERLRRFGRLMGGSRVLQSVNRLLEQRWVSAANHLAE